MKKPMTRQQISRIRKQVNVEALALSAELVEMAHGDKNHLIYTDASKDCKTCYGRGYNESTTSPRSTMKKVPCSCALRKAQKRLDNQKNMPVFAVIKKVGDKEVIEYTYAKSKLENATPTEGIFHKKV